MRTETIFKKLKNLPNLLPCLAWLYNPGLVHFLTEFSQVYARPKFFVMGSLLAFRPCMMCDSVRPTIDFAKTHKFQMTNFFDEKATLNELNEHSVHWADNF